WHTNDVRSRSFLHHYASTRRLLGSPPMSGLALVRDRLSAWRDGVSAGGFRLGLAERLLAERTRWALWLPVVLGAGIALYFELASEPPLAAGGVALALAALLLLALCGRPVLFGGACAGFAAALGFAAAQFAAWGSAAPVLDKRLGPA